ncbi:MAG: TolC family protein [Spirochaetaceae bacterium]|jgi:outer membrane protein TolC|nr:TolC family protein [Spirochaetaceae bacterium]
MKRYVVAVLFTALGMVVAAQQEEPVTGEKPVRTISVDEAVSLALNNNLGLQASQVTLEKKKRPAVLSWNQFLPTVGLSGSLSAANSVSTQNVPIGISGGQLMYRTVEGPRWGLNAAFQIQWSGLNVAMFEGVRKLKRDYEAGEIGYQKAKLQLERDIRKLYSSILLAEENLKVQEQSFTLAEEQVRTAQANYNAGLSAELTLMQARLNRDKLIPDIDLIKNNIKVSMANFAMLLGLPYDTEFTLVSTEQVRYDVPFDTAELIRNAAGSKVDLQELRANIVALRTARNAMRYQLWTPSLSLGWTLNPTFSGDPFRDSWSGDSWTDTGRFSLNLSWSLNGMLPFTKEVATLRDLNDDIRSLDINLAQAIRATEVEVYNQVFLVQQARESIDAQQKTVELAERTYRDTLAAFRAGLRDFMEVQNVEQQLRQARLGVLQQQYNFFTGVIDLEYAVGVPFGTMIQ